MRMIAILVASVAFFASPALAAHHPTKVEFRPFAWFFRDFGHPTWQQEPSERHHARHARRKRRHAPRRIIIAHKSTVVRHPRGVLPVPAPHHVPFLPAARPIGFALGHKLVRAQTFAGPIVVAEAYASRFIGFIDDLVREGHRHLSIGCYAAHGHMRNSLHHWGGACDIDQTARNRTAPFMYHVTALAHAHGLTDGCEFSRPDCGHLQVAGFIGRHHVRRSRKRHYARAI